MLLIWSKAVSSSTIDSVNEYSLNFAQLFLIFIVISGFIGLFFIFRIIKLKIGGEILNVKLFVIIVFSIFVIDNINGSSIILPYKSSFRFYESNFAGSPVIMLSINLVNINANSAKPLINSKLDESITFKQYSNDHSGNQMLIIVESFGLINDTIKRTVFQKCISTVFEKNNWKTSWGKTKFTGSTTRSELRELLNCVGDYRYFINSKNSLSVKSIFQIKKHRGYLTNAIHSFKPSMFERGIWWKNIGVDKVYFSGDVQFNNKKIKLNYDSPFISVNDEDSFDFLQNKTSNTSKQFSYLLTENSHLPFKGNPVSPIFTNFFDIDQEINLSTEAKNQSKRISNFLVYVARHLDSNKFQKLIIVGDHMPPFLIKGDRAFYSDQFVPYCIVTK
jgi:hypothetical protein